MKVNKVYFAQHGLAIEKTENPERPLSVMGMEQSKFIATQLATSKTNISKIFHSGKLRAAQTAEVFAESLNITTMSAVSYLSPNYDIVNTTKFLDTDSALYIGHLPHLDKLTSYLITGDKNGGLIHFQNSAVLCLDKTTPQFKIQWYLTPELLVRA
jgi:phosphohistidine phosphatase